MSVKKINVLITGASGLLGRTVYKYFTDKTYRERYPISASEELNWNVLGLCNSRLRDGLKKLDLTNNEEVEKLINEFKPDVIIHCAAEKKVEVVENDFEKALKLNSGATEFLARLSAKLGIFFVYVSTDYVFDGTKPPYKTDDKVNPLNKYGMSKHYGEKVTTEASEKHCIVRVPVLYGYTETDKLGESAVNILVEKVRLGKSYTVDHVQTRFPTHCIDVASGLEAFTKYDMSIAIAESLNLAKDHIQPDMNVVTTGPNQRPMNAQLDTVYSYSVLDFKPIMEFKKSIKDCLENFA